MPLPRSSIPSVAHFMSGLKMKNRDEQGLMVRIGTLIDAIIAAQRGTNNAGSNLDKKTNVTNRNTPPTVDGTAQNIFDGISVNLTAVTDPSSLSNYEVQVDSDPNFSDPRLKQAFSTDMTFKGLTSETDYHVRARALTKDGIVSDWKSLGVVTTGATPGVNTSDVDGTFWGEPCVSKTFTFNSTGEDLFAVGNFGQLLLDTEGSQTFYLFQDGADSGHFVSTAPHHFVDDGFTWASEFVGVDLYRPLAFFDLLEPGDAPSTHSYAILDNSLAFSTQGSAFVKF